MEMKVFVFSVESFYCNKFDEKEAKPDKPNFKRGLVVTFDVKNSYYYWKKNRIQIFQAYFFKVGDQAICIFAKVQFQ